MRLSPPIVALGLAATFGLLAGGMQAGRLHSRIVEAPLCRAVGRGDLPTVRRLLDEGASPNLRTYGGLTALGLAMVQDRWPIAELLFERGGDVNAQAYGMPLLRVAALSDDWDGYDWLLERGARPDPKAGALAERRPPRDGRYKPFPHFAAPDRRP